jgi:hypothetical protein
MLPLANLPRIDLDAEAKIRRPYGLVGFVPVSAYRRRDFDLRM